MKHRVPIRFWYGIFLAVFTAVLAIVLIVTASSIYYADPEGEPYSRALVGERLLPLIAPIVLYVVAVIAGGVLSYVFPSERKDKAGRDVAYRRLRAKLPPLGDGEDDKKLRTFEIWRLVIWAVCAAFSLAAAIVTLVLLCRTANFSGIDPTAEILSMLRISLPFIGGAFGLCMVASLYEILTLKPRMDCAVRILAARRGEAAEVSPVGAAAERALGVVRSDAFVWTVRGVLLALGLTLLILGIVNGGAGDVLGKAIRICYECVGIG